MTTRILRDQLLVSLTICLASTQANAQTSAPTDTETSSAAPADVVCAGTECISDEGVVMRLRTRGERQPLTDQASDNSQKLQPDRRVTIEAEKVLSKAPDEPGKAAAIAKWSVQLPGGGSIWAVEDPNLGQPMMNVSATSFAAFDGGQITKPVRFYVYNNYAKFISRAEILVYNSTDTDYVTPLATIPLELGAVSEANWDGKMADGAGLRVGDELIYIVRVWGEDGKSFDETYARRIQLVTPEDAERGAQVLRDSIESKLGSAFSSEEAEQRSMVDSVFGENSLAKQNIPIYGSRIRIMGRNIPEGYALAINGRQYPVDLERKMVAEYLVPVGEHKFDLELTGKGGTLHHTLDVDVTGRYLFMVGLADVTVSGSSVTGSVEPLASNDRYDDDFLVDGRLAFYLKGKIKGKYLITAQADTREREVEHLFDGFWKADPQDVFRRLDPDEYYPVYGDDSTTYRDVDTQGKLYIRVDWDKNQALFGNFNTGITGTEYGQYNRALYGAALSLRSNRNTENGDAGTQVKAFASEAQTAPGHTEFLGTGGSLYYLKHTDVLPGSDRIVLEVRDNTTGRTEQRIDLLRGADYEIDEMQGRIILTRPLAQVTRENVPGITRDTPLDGFSQVLLVDYEYVPSGVSLSETTVGFRGKHWFGDHVAVGGTYIDENRAGEDYSLKGADLTLQAGRGTFIKVEHSRSKATSAPVFFSDNGGLSFTEMNSEQNSGKGSATAVEAAINFKELGWTQQDWTAAAWWRDVDSGFSVSRADTNSAIEEYGAEVRGKFSPSIGIYSRYSRAERGAEALTQAQVNAEVRLGEKTAITAEIKHVDEERGTGDGSATLAALQIQQRIGSSVDLYASGQIALDEGGSYKDNDSVTVGGKYRFGDLSNVGAEFTHGDRGDAAQVNGEVKMGPDHTFYGSYTYSTDRTDYDQLFNSRTNTGWTIGQRWRLSNKVSIFNESQFLKSPNESGLGHTFGMNFYPAQGWNLGFTVQAAELDKEITGTGTGTVDRRALSVNGGLSTINTQWQSKLEWRKDTGAERREQWVTTNRLTHKFSDSFRVAARLNYSETKDRIDATAGAKFIEANVGFALRPALDSKWALLGKYTFLYDVSSLEQVGDNVAFYDQKSQIFSMEGIYKPDQHWEFAGKALRRDGEVRFGRLEGQWADSGATFLAGQVRYGFADKWHALAEYRWLDVDHGGTRQGVLVGIDRDISDNFRIGVGYNFTKFSDDLTDFDYDHKGWFLNLVGRY